ncbi:PEBP-like protein, partial [Coniochaeta sp. PMI_546]
LQKAEIIPTVIDDFLPILILDVEWSKKNYASLGNTLKPKKLQDAPSVTLKGPAESTDACGSNIQFIITLTDPDAPSRDNPKWSEMCHWIAAGISTPAELDLGTGKCAGVTLTKLDEIMPYKPPGPPEKTGKHRYVFLVFAPANGTTDELHLSKPSDRKHWGGGKEGHGVRDWAHENGLVPVAANFIYAQNKKQ